MGIAYAHDLYPPLRDSIFHVKWAYDPTLILFVVLVILYVRGLRAFKGRSPVRRWQKALYFTGMAVLIGALVPPIDLWSDQMFSIHMVQHMLITCVGVPLMIFGVPFFVTVRGLPPWVRRRVYFPLIRSRIVRGGFAVAQNPIVALFAYEGTFWFWHVPRFYNAALLNDGIHLVEHFCMAVSALNLWRIVIDPYPMRSPLKLPLRIFYLGFMTALDVALSSALTYSDTSWYAYDGLPMPSWWHWSRLEDQHLGGLIMWVPGGFLEFLAMTITFFVWSSREQAKDRRTQAAAALAAGDDEARRPAFSAPILAVPAAP